MTETSNRSSQSAADDPRVAFAKVTDAVGGLIEATEAMQPGILAGSTPCPDFTVEYLLDHILMVMGRVAAIGNGQHFSTVEHESHGSDRAKSYRSSADDVMAAWTDGAKLEQVFEVPWGEFPGAPILYSYTGEVAVHGWDLAVATGQEFSVADELLHGALMAAKFIPAEGRETPELPFGQVVDPGLDAPVLLQLAGWLGRNVND